jgi:hypothetical protein
MATSVNFLWRDLHAIARWSRHQYAHQASASHHSIAPKPASSTAKVASGIMIVDADAAMPQY